MVDTKDRRCELIRLMQGYGVSLTEEQVRLMLQHVDLVVEKNKVLNLTRIVDPDAALMLHVVDSLLLIPELRRHAPAASSLLDVGTGAGFPGIPLGIALGCETWLLDSVGKKVTAVNEFISKLGIEERFHPTNARVEEFAMAHPQEFDMVTCRAVAELKVLVEYASPLLVDGGVLCVSKALLQEAEWSEGIACAEICGMTNVSRETLELPQGYGTRELVTFKQTRRSKVKLPRKTGLAKHKPLV